MRRLLELVQYCSADFAAVSFFGVNRFGEPKRALGISANILTSRTVSPRRAR